MIRESFLPQMFPSIIILLWYYVRIPTIITGMVLCQGRKLIIIFLLPDVEIQGGASILNCASIVAIATSYLENAHNVLSH